MFFSLFQHDHILHGSWFDFNLSWWNTRQHGTTFFCTYEDMHYNCKKVVQDLSSFLGKDITEDMIEKIVDHTSFGKMKDNAMVNKEEFVFFDKSRSSFMRKGKIGDYVNHFTAEQNEHTDKQLAERLGGSGLWFDFKTLSWTQFEFP